MVLVQHHVWPDNKIDGQTTYPLCCLFVADCSTLLPESQVYTGVTYKYQARRMATA